MDSHSIPPREARRRQQAGALLIDVRTDHERTLGMAEGALGVAREALLRDPAAHIAAQTSEVLLLCQAGVRSERCAHALAALGYRNLSSVQGGTQAWAAAHIGQCSPEV